MADKKAKLELLKKKWISFQSDNKKIRIRDAANQLGVSEAELLSTEICQNTFFLSINNYNTFFQDILSLDKIMFLIRSNSVVHEKIVRTKDIKLINNYLFYNESNNSNLLKFDIKLFKYAFFQSKKHRKIDLKSFQIFNFKGDAILKIYLKGDDKIKFNEIGLKYKCNYNYELQSKSVVKSNNNNPKKHIDLYFKDIVEKSKKREYFLKENPLRRILASTSKSKELIQIYAIGLGTIQYHEDIVDKIIDYGPWINVIDEDFNLHVLEKKLTQFILTEYKNKSQLYYAIDFYDCDNKRVLGITSVKGREDSFNKAIQTLGAIK